MQKDAPTADIQTLANGNLGILILLALTPFLAFMAFTMWYHLLAMVESVFHIERQAAPKAQA